MVTSMESSMGIFDFYDQNFVRQYLEDEPLYDLDDKLKDVRVHLNLVRLFEIANTPLCLSL